MATEISNKPEKSVRLGKIVCGILRSAPLGLTRAGQNCYEFVLGLRAIVPAKSVWRMLLMCGREEAAKTMWYWGQPWAVMVALVRHTVILGD